SAGADAIGEAFWDACISGRSGIRRITRFDASNLLVQIAGEVTNFCPEALGLTEDEHKTLDRAAQYAIAAANFAMQDAGLVNMLSEEEHDDIGVAIGTAMACVDGADILWAAYTDSGMHPPRIAMNDFIVPTPLMTHASAAAIANHHQLHGPCFALTTACSAGADAIGEAFWAIQGGYADRMLAGGSDSAITRLGIGVFSNIGALSMRNEEPERASRPYDRDRDGFVLAEGAGVLVLEEREMALARGAHIYAEVITFNSNSNSYHMTSLPENGAPLQQLLRQVLFDAQISREQLDYINSHGSSTVPNEVAETAAYKAVFDEYAYRIPISSTKSMIGHTQGAASAIEAIVTALTLEQQIIPPTINQENPDPRCDLDYVPNVARQATVNVALTHSSGFGGVNSALILARPDWLEKKL
ncbi:MAG TPA: beta-ketoacyl-[acyl-carrier-protein] synthase family protein, partial [Ktedonobacteraceae bacterium]|nr:beta-ketoacyl-[acyl-carrier-protein] synthase family protein [Ktedonobacteraceae bacterium]